jgi:excisionase family DNA binding protein
MKMTQMTRQPLGAGALTATNPNERLIRVLQATSAQLATIDKILDGEAAVPTPMAAGPLLLPMGKAAELLGVSRPTLWRMLNAGLLTRVEVLPNTYRVSRSEIEALVNGNKSTLPARDRSNQPTQKKDHNEH